MSTLIERLEKIATEKQLPGVRGQIGLVQHSGASKAMVNHWLEGRVKSVKPEYAFRMERELGYRAEWIMLGRLPERVGMAQVIPLPHPDLTPWGEVMELLDLFRQTNATGRTVMLVSCRKTAKTHPGDSSASHKE